MRTYAPIQEALKTYLSEGWQVEILPWVVAVCGLLGREVIKRCLEFLETPRECWRMIIDSEDTAKESVKAFHFLHCVRFKALRMGL